VKGISFTRYGDANNLPDEFVPGNSARNARSSGRAIASE